MLSLLHRYGDRHGLRFALPVRYQFGYPRLFQASRVKGYRPQDGDTQPRFHILCHHMRFNLKEVRGMEGWVGLEIEGPRWGLPKIPSLRRWAWGPQGEISSLSSADPSPVVFGSQSPAFPTRELTPALSSVSFSH